MKAAIVIEPSQPLGLLINTASVLSVSMGDMIKGIRGRDTTDASGVSHAGMICIPLPILQAEHDVIREVWHKAREDEDIFVADFTRIAQSCRSYEEYIDKCGNTQTDEMGLLGIAIYGNKKKINKLVGNLKTIR